MIPLLSAPAALALPPAGIAWTRLLEQPVVVECSADEADPYCRSTAVIEAPVATVVETFIHLDQHVAAMKKVGKIVALEPDVWHVVMDYPFPLSDRDYVAKYTHRAEPDGTAVFSWVPISHPRAPADGSTVRLARMDGEWRFAPVEGGTRITYLWHSDPGGALPDVSSVYKQAGQYSVEGLAAACKARIVGR